MIVEMGTHLGRMGHLVKVCTNVCFHILCLLIITHLCMCKRKGPSSDSLSNAHFSIV